MSRIKPVPDAPAAAPSGRDVANDASHTPQSLVENLANRLFQVSSHPFRAVKDHLIYRLLTALAGKRRIFPKAMADRFRSSAAKRDPNRYRALARMPASAPHQGSGTPRRDIRSPEFMPYATPAPIKPDVKVICFYLPQFHPFAENDAWWGKGFTEWTNVGKALPIFEGHYQPHCPIHFGYYDLRIPAVMEEQAKIAREYGVGGFAYYFYWFGGKTLMEAPLRGMLENPAIDMPFCLSWANENWTRRWDGAEHDVLIGQQHSLEDSRALLRHLADYFNDPRYIRIGNKPVFMVYRADIIPDIKATTDMWRAEAQALGFEGLYLMATQTSGPKDPRRLGFDAAVEFPPLGFGAPKDLISLNVHNPNFTGRIHDYRAVVERALADDAPRYPFYRTAMLSWDNTARKHDRADIFADFSIGDYRRWLGELCRRARHRPGASDDEKIVFVNAWNEWAEGTHLEPDQWLGFAYLHATYEAVSKKT